MKKITRSLAKRIIKNHQNIDNLKVRLQYGLLEGWVSIVLNLLLFTIKLAIGLSIKSVSLIADAIHSLADSGTSLVVILGFKIARKPSDREHPFGHGRMESIVALVIAVLLFVVSVELLEKSIYRIFHPSASRASLLIILIIGATALIKEFMSKFSNELGEMIDSKALKADALHHRSDVFATLVVVVALIGSYWGYTRLDGIMGIVVSFVIFFSAYSIAKEAVHPLLGEAPSSEKIREIEDLAMQHSGVLGVHEIIIHTYGLVRMISLHLEVSDKSSAYELHRLSEEVEESISKKLKAQVIAHIDPVNKDHPFYDQISQSITDITSRDKRISSFHDLRIVGADPGMSKAIFDIVLEEDYDEQERYDIIWNTRVKFMQKFPHMKVVIKAEPKFATIP